MSVEEKTTSSCNSHGNTIGRSIGCGCLTTPGLVFVVYKYIYLRLLKDGYTSSQSVGFWINILLVVPFVFIGAILAFEGGFRLIHFLHSRIRSLLLWKKKDHGESNGPTPIDPLD